MNLHPERSPDSSIHAGEHANVNRVEISERTLSIFGLAMASAALVMAGVAWYQTSIAERETRMLQYYLLELDAKFIAAGLKKPDEAISGQLRKKE